MSTTTTGQAGFAANMPKKGEISMEKAQDIATKEVEGKIKSSEYEFEKGQNIYSFDIAAKEAAEVKAEQQLSGHSSAPCRAASVSWG